MNKVKISIIAAIGENRELGKDNKLLWHIPEDMERFKQITLGHPVIMGRTTYESIGKPLTGRTNIVITRDQSCQITDCLVCHSIEEAMEKAKELDNKEIFLIGGGQIYGQGIKYTDKLYLTVVKGNFDADTYFPDYAEFNKIIFQKESHDKHYGYTFLELER